MCHFAMLWTLPNPEIGAAWMVPWNNNNKAQMEAITLAVIDHAGRLLGPCKHTGLQRYEVQGALSLIMDKERCAHLWWRNIRTWVFCCAVMEQLKPFLQCESKLLTDPKLKSPTRLYKRLHRAAENRSKIISRDMWIYRMTKEIINQKGSNEADVLDSFESESEEEPGGCDDEDNSDDQDDSDDEDDTSTLRYEGGSNCSCNSDATLP